MGNKGVGNGVYPLPNNQRDIVATNPKLQDLHTYSPHSRLPHLSEFWGGAVDQAGILCPRRTRPLGHG